MLSIRISSCNSDFRNFEVDISFLYGYNRSGVSIYIKKFLPLGQRRLGVYPIPAQTPKLKIRPIVVRMVQVSDG